MHDDKRILAFTALIVGIISISWSAIFVRWTDMPGVASAFYRVLIASVALWAVLLMQRGRRLRISPQLIPLTALGGIFFAADLGLYNVHHTTVVFALPNADGTRDALGNV